MNKEILRLAVPNIISNITIPLLGMVDIAITGHLDSKAYLGAIAVGAMIFNFIYWMFGFLRMGISGITAQAYGAKDTTEINATLYRGLIIALLGAVFLILLQIPIEKLAFRLLSGSPDVELYAKEYFYIRIWAAPATIGMYALMGWFIGMQNTVIPMVIAISINAANIGFNLFFVKVLGMKSDGVALGTVIAQYIGLALSLVFLFTKYKSALIRVHKKQLLNKEKLLSFFKVNRDIFLRTLSIIMVLTFFTSHSASQSTIILDVNTILLQFLFLFSFITDGFAYAAEALTGKYYGAKQGNTLKILVNKLLVWGFGMAIAFTILYALAQNQILALLTNQSEILQASRSYAWWVLLIPITSFASFIWDGVFIGLTASKAMRNTMMIATFIVFFPVWFLLKEYYDNHALWFAFIMFYITRGLAQSVIYYSKLIKAL